MTGRMCDEMDLMVWYICGIFFCVSTVPSNYTDNRIGAKKYDRIYIGRRIASSMIEIFSITYAHSTFNCHSDRMNVEPITVQTQY